MPLSQWDRKIPWQTPQNGGEGAWAPEGLGSSGKSFPRGLPATGTEAPIMGPGPAPAEAAVGTMGVTCGEAFSVLRNETLYLQTVNYFRSAALAQLSGVMRGGHST